MKETSIEQLLLNGRIGAPYMRWPERGPGNRLEPEAWPQLFPRFVIKPGATIFTSGSCFARDIEDHLHRQGFDVPMVAFKDLPGEYAENRTSVLNRFTPTAIHREFEWGARIFRQGGEPTLEQLTESLLDLPDGRCVDVHLGGLLAVPKEIAIRLRRQLAAVVSKAFSADVVIITLGLIETWWDREEQHFIQRIPLDEMIRAYPGRFSVRRLSFDECLQRMRDTLDLLRAEGKPGKRFLVTTSPVPMYRTFADEDVLIANTFSKSLLRSVAGCLADEHPDVDYFPSYETVLLSSDRNDVWYDDLLHVRESFVAKIMQRFIASYSEGSVASVLSSAERALCSGSASEALAALEAVDPSRSIDSFERKAYHRASVRALRVLGRMNECPPHLDAIMSMGITEAAEGRGVADVWGSLGMPERALQALEHVNIDEFDLGSVREHRAHFLIRLQRLPEALEEYRRALSIWPRASVHRKSAEICARLGLMDEAERHLAAAGELDRQNGKTA